MVKNTPELIELQKEAKKLGLVIHHMSGPQKYKDAIAKYYAEKRVAEARTTANPNPPMPDEVLAAEPSVHIPQTAAQPMTEAEFIRSSNRKRKLHLNRLVRVRLQCMNPLKKEWPGEFISVGSAKVGTFKKFIPYNSDEPYHVPAILYEALKEKKCTVFTNKLLPNGQKVRKGKAINEYAIEVLEPLTKEEIRVLAQQQAMAAGQDV